MVKVLLEIQVESMGTLGVHGKGQEHRNKALLVDLLFTILPAT